MYHFVFSLFFRDWTRISLSHTAATTKVIDHNLKYILAKLMDTSTRVWVCVGVQQGDKMRCRRGFMREKIIIFFVAPKAFKDMRRGRGQNPYIWGQKCHVTVKLNLFFSSSPPHHTYGKRVQFEVINQVGTSPLFLRHRL